jgi:hypothetical protein
MAQQVGSTSGTAPAARAIEARVTEAGETEARAIEALETGVTPGGNRG